MSVMRAAVVRGDRLAVEERPMPVPGPGEILARVRACGVCGSDLHYVHHFDGLTDIVRAMGGATDALIETRRRGAVLGHEFVCEIIDFGVDTTRALQSGQRVCSMPFLLRPDGAALHGSSPEITGGFAEFMLLTETLCLPVEESLPDEAAALVEPVAVAVHAVNRAAMTPHDVAVVVGCGPVGLTTIAVLKARGCTTIIASDLSARRRELAAAMGADQVIDGARASIMAAAVEAAPGAPLVVFESTGAHDMLHRLILEAPRGARILCVGIPAGEERILPMAAIIKEIQLNFVIYYTPDEFASALDLIRRGAVDWRLLVTGTVGLDHVTDAFAALSQPEVHAKILIEPWRDGALQPARRQRSEQ